MQSLSFDQIPNVLGKINEKLDRLEKSINSQKEKYREEKKYKFVEAAKYVGESEPAFRLHIAQNRVKRIKTGKHLLFLKRDLDEYLEKHRIRTQEEIQADAHNNLVNNRKKY